MEEQITFALREAERGDSMPDVCRKLSVSDPTFRKMITIVSDDTARSAT